MNFQKLFGKVFGQNKEDDLSGFAGLTKAKPGDRPATVRMRRRRVNARNQFADIRMTRGVQKAIAASGKQPRLEVIWASMRQGVEIATTRRAAYLKRRGARWRKHVENIMPGMFQQAMVEQGLGAHVGL